MLDVLRAIVETISSSGLNKSTPGGFEGPARVQTVAAILASCTSRMGRPTSTT